MADETYHYFYVLLCKDGTFYGGYTTEPERRLKEHNQGVGAKYTRLPSRRPAKMIYTEKFSTRSAATKAEYAFKKLSRQQKEQYLKVHQKNRQINL
jgi:putative endonuclease